jgi:glycine cleavage system regulatory protein
MAKNLTAAQSGDRKQALEVLRDTLAAQIDTTEANVHAQLSAQYRATLAELAEIAGTLTKPKGSIDELKSRREDRRTTSDASANA